jgi:hypothetical protein
MLMVFRPSGRGANRALFEDDGRGVFLVGVLTQLW